MATKQPRDGSVMVGGHPWMGRMIDKARLDAAGEIEAFDLVYPCPMDRQLLGRLGVDAPMFQRIATQNETDEAIVKALQEAGAAVSV